MPSLQQSTQQLEQNSLRLFYDGKIEEGIGLLRSELNAADPNVLSSADRARLLAVMGKLHSHQAFLMNSSLDVALESLNEAVQIAEELGENETLGIALSYRGFATYTNTFHNAIGHYQDALPDIDRSLEIREEIEDVRGIAESLIYQGILYERTEQPARANANYERAAQITHEHGFELEESYAVRHLAFIRQNDGDLEGAREYFERSLELRQKAGFRTGLALSHFSLGGVLLDLKRYDEALEQLNHAESYASEFGLTRVRTLCHYLLGEGATAQGDVDEAVAQLERSRDLSREIDYEVGVQREETKLRELLSG